MSSPSLPVLWRGLLCPHSPAVPGWGLLRCCAQTRAGVEGSWCVSAPVVMLRAPISPFLVCAVLLQVRGGKARAGSCSWWALWACELEGELSLHGALADGWGRRRWSGAARALLDSHWLEGQGGMGPGLSMLYVRISPFCYGGGSAAWPCGHLLSCPTVLLELELWPLHGGQAAQWWGCAHLTHSLEARRGMALVASMPLPAGPGCDFWLVLQGHQDCGALSLQLVFPGHKLHLLKST